MTDRIDNFEPVGVVAERVVRKAGGETPIDQFAWWRSALTAPNQIGKSLKISVDTPMPGFYRSRFKDRPWEPIAIWEQDGVIIAKRGEKIVDAAEVWNFCCKNPISYDAYERAVEFGDWEDADPIVASQLRGPPRPGDNAGDRSESEMLADDIKAALDQMRLYKAIGDDDTAGKAQSLRARLNELSGKADKIREKLVRPHLDAQRDINGEWQPLVKDAKSGADSLRKTLEGYETKKLRERRAAEEAARKAEEEAANREAELSFVAGEAEPEVITPPPAAAAPFEPFHAQVRGAYGTAAAVRAKRVVTAITNPIELFKEVASDPRVEALLMKIAQERIDGGYTVAGVVVEERASVR